MYDIELHPGLKTLDRVPDRGGVEPEPEPGTRVPADTGTRVTIHYLLAPPIAFEQRRGKAEGGRHDFVSPLSTTHDKERRQKASVLP